MTTYPLCFCGSPHGHPTYHGPFDHPPYSFNRHLGPPDLRGSNKLVSFFSSFAHFSRGTHKNQPNKPGERQGTGQNRAPAFSPQRCARRSVGPRPFGASASQGVGKRRSAERLRRLGAQKERSPKTCLKRPRIFVFCESASKPESLSGCGGGKPRLFTSTKARGSNPNPVPPIQTRKLKTGVHRDRKNESMDLFISTLRGGLGLRNPTHYLEFPMKGLTK